MFSCQMSLTYLPMVPDSEYMLQVVDLPCPGQCCRPVGSCV